MNTQLKTFAFESHQLRIEADDNGEPLFHANDLCAILGYSNPRDALAKHVDTEDVAKRDTLTAGGIQQAAFLREPGMWSLIMRSNAANAKPVQRWVVAEVLPSIRKTGSYGTPDLLKPVTTPMTFTEVEQHSKKLHRHVDELVKKIPLRGTMEEWEQVKRRKFFKAEPQASIPGMDEVNLEGVPLAHQFSILLEQHLDKLKANGSSYNAITAARSKYRKEFAETGEIPKALLGIETRGSKSKLPHEIISRFEELVIQSSDSINPDAFVPDSERTVVMLQNVLKFEFKQPVSIDALYNHLNNHPDLKARFPKTKAGV